MPEETKISYEGQQISSKLPGKEGPDLADKLVQWGIVSTQEQAVRVLLGFIGVAVLIIVISLYIMRSGPRAVATGEVNAAMRNAGIPAAAPGN